MQRCPSRLSASLFISNPDSLTQSCWVLLYLVRSLWPFLGGHSGAWISWCLTDTTNFWQVFLLLLCILNWSRMQQAILSLVMSFHFYLQWPPVAPSIRFKTLMLICRHDGNCLIAHCISSYSPQVRLGFFYQLQHSPLVPRYWTF